MLREGRSAAEIAAALGVSPTTYHRWRRRYGGLTAAEVTRLQELERENALLRRILADKELENETLRQLSRGGW